MECFPVIQDVDVFEGFNVELFLREMSRILRKLPGGSASLQIFLKNYLTVRWSFLTIHQAN